ncbi:MAG: amino acid transporter, partial [Planctomycetaceae bacterium]|nr:amino acid transporter [Planctomycetaceae bacterium]
MTTPETPDSKHPARLTRRLGLGIALAVVVGNVIGSGIYLKPGTIARDGGSLGLIMFVWAFGGLLCILGGLCFAELGTMYPQAGGLYVYLKEAYGRLVAFLFGWIEFLFARPASIGALAVAFTGELPLGENPSDWLVVGVGSGVILAMAAVNIIGVLWGGRVQLVTTVLKVASLVFIICVPLAIGGFGAGSVSLSNYATTSTPADPNLGVRLGAVLLAVMWAYNGWHGITPLAEEVRDPQRNIPLALFGGIGILIVLYVCTNLAYHSVLTMDEMAGAGQKAADR